MAWDTSTIGDAASGADYAADAGAIQLWEGAIDADVAGDYEGKVITDINEDVTFSGFSNAKKVWLHGDQTGAAKRVVTLNTTTESIILVNQGGGVITEFILEDLILDGLGTQSSSDYGFWINDMDSTTTMRRVEIKGCARGFRSGSSNDGSVNADNVIVHNCSVFGFDIQTRNTYDCTIRNCGFFKNTGDGFSLVQPASGSVTVECQNCVSLNNTTDFDASSGTPLIANLREGVSSDGTATSGSGFDTYDNCVDSKTSYTSYFNDWDNDDFTLKNDDNTNWGINGDSANTPADDFASTTRTNDDIGPYEYAAAGGGGSRDLLICGTGA